jgi:uncharacterized protein (TIGR02147 family)
MSDYRQFLRSELLRRQKANAGYSLRAFSKHLSVSPAQLSQVLSGKRTLTGKAALKIAEKLALSPSERKQLLESIFQQRLEVLVPPGEGTQAEREELEEESFRVVSDWYHFAMLSLFEIPGAKADPRWIGNRLGISALEAAGAFKRLKKLGLVSTEGKRIVLSQKAVKVDPKHRSAAVVRFHQQILARASSKIESTPLDQREFRALTLAMDPKQLPKAQEKLRTFLNALASELESGSKKEVFVLSVQLFPLTGGSR